MRHDVVYAVRGLLRRPGFALAAILTLALGIGANAAICRSSTPCGSGRSPIRTLSA